MLHIINALMYAVISTKYSIYYTYNI